MNSRQKRAHLNELIDLLTRSKAILSVFNKKFGDSQQEGFDSAIQVLEGLKNHPDYDAAVEEIFAEMMSQE